MEKKVRKFIEQIIVFSEENLNISREKIESFVKEKSKSFGEGGKQIIAFFNSLLSTLGSFVVVLVFMFLFMLQREKYEIFFLKLYKNGNPDESKKVLGDICKVAQRYLFGRVLSIIILTVLYFAALAIIGVKNAFLLSVIAALATIIPYVGTVAGSLFPCLMAIITEDSIAPAIAVLAAIFLIQTVDNYFIEPYIVGGEVNLSAFFSIFGLMAGGLLWGIAGVILFLPLLGILKIVFEHVKELEPYAYLIGDQKSKSPIEKKLEKLWKSFKKK
jgi:predicted PurR-regulated permease PerM